MEFIPVQSFNNYVEAHIAMGNLQQQHINCWLKDEYTVTIDPILANAVGGIKLMVAKVQVPRAIELLERVSENKQPHYACPYCGSRAIQWVAAPAKKVNLFTALISRLFGRDDFATKQLWHCATCGKDCEQPNEVNKEAIKEVQ
jgi:DNA-directed RNA polymerase subunit RPC12/RpoP